MIEDGWIGHPPVGNYRANGFGLHDTAGNVWQWCRDDYDYDSNDLPTEPATGAPPAPLGAQGRPWWLLRGHPESIRSAHRSAPPSGYRDQNIGSARRSAAP